MKIRIDEQKRISDICKKLITLEEPMSSTTAKSYYAEEVFNKLSLHIISFTKNLPKPDENNDFFDISILAAIARMIIEAANAVLYFSDHGLTKEELEFRFVLYGHHQISDQLKILNKLKIDDRHFKYLENYRIPAFERNKYYQKLTPKEKKNLLTGNKAFYKRGKQTKTSPFEKELEEGIYKLLSNFVHSFPVGIATYKQTSDQTPFNLMNAVFLVTEVTICFSAAAILAYARLRNKIIGSRLDQEEKKFLKESCTPTYIYEWINQENIRQKNRLF